MPTNKYLSEKRAKRKRLRKFKKLQKRYGSEEYWQPTLKERKAFLKKQKKG